MRILRFLFLLAVVSCVSRSIVAQASSLPIRVHGSTQCSFYVAKETPIDPGVTCHMPSFSAQAHWGPSNSVPCNQSLGLLNPCVGHVHIECDDVPLWGELITKIVLPCNIVLFHLKGGIPWVNQDEGTVIWDANNSSNTPNGFLNGDPAGVLKFPFKFTIDPARWAATIPHGWFTPVIYLRAFITQGAATWADNVVFDTRVIVPFYSVADLTAPERPTTCDGCGAVLRADAKPFVPHDNPPSWDSWIIQTTDILPMLGPITAMVTSPNMLGYTYGGGPAGSMIAMADIDLHNGSEGRAITFGKFDPVEIGAGVHKIASIWKGDRNELTANFPALESVASLLVVTMNVGGSTPTPTTCQDLTATNFGGPLPCTYPVDVCPNITGVQVTVPTGMVLLNGQCVVPPVTTGVGTVQWEQNGSTLQFKLCPGNDPSDPRCQAK